MVKYKTLFPFFQTENTFLVLSIFSSRLRTVWGGGIKPEAIKSLSPPSYNSQSRRFKLTSLIVRLACLPAHAQTVPAAQLAALAAEQ